MQLTSQIHRVDDIDAAAEFCHRQRWTDGLPVTPPTRPAIERMLAHLGRDPTEVVGIVPPRNGIASIEKIVINCVMAGCLPGYVPIVIAALQAMLEERFNLNGVQTTAHCCAPLCIVSGPAVADLGFNTREGAFGSGCRPSASIGRALRLILWNIGGGYPGEPCKTTLAHPGYFSFCIAEDAQSNPWEALHVERGFRPEDTVVTLSAVTAPQQVATAAGYGSPEDVLYLLADAITPIGSNNITGGDLVVVLGPMAARNLAQSGRSKMDVKHDLMRMATRSVRDLRHRKTIAESNPLHWSHLVEPGNEDAQIPFIRSPDNLVLTTTGGWASGAGFCCVCAGWGSLGGLTVSKRVEFPRH